MKTLIVYDSGFGNTERIAKAIGSAITGDVTVFKVGEANLSTLNSIDLLIIGSPTYGGRPTSKIMEFINGIPEAAIKSIKVAAFDTRLSTKWVGIFGYAAGKIAENLKVKGGNLVSPPAAFFVKGKEGPLKEGELERAASWAKEIVG